MVLVKLLMRATRVVLVMLTNFLLFPLLLQCLGIERIEVGEFPRAAMVSTFTHGFKSLNNCHISSEWCWPY